MVTACEGLKVLDFTSGLAGALATMFLSDNGAEVIKVEPPWGDLTRVMPAHLMWNRGKKSVVLDLKSDEGLAAARRLAQEADVVTESFRPGVAARLGIDYETLSADNPMLVYGSISGLGQRGAWKNIPGYEGIVAAKIGRFSGEDGWRKEGPIFFPVPVLSYGAAHLVTQGILAALLARRRLGRGQWVQTSLVQAATVYANSNWMVRPDEEESLAQPARAWASPHDNMAAGYQIGECADGKWLQIASTTVRLFRSFMQVLGLEKVYDDPRFDDMPYSFPTPEERTAVLNEVKARLKQKTAAEWMRLFGENGNVGGEPFITTQEAMRHPQFLHNGHVVDVQDPQAGATKQISPLARMSETPSRVAGPAPALGEYTEQTLTRLGAGRSPWTSDGSRLALPSGPTPRCPLETITVLELGNHIAGPFGATLLAEMGARVIKVEPPEGDLLRRIVDASVKTIQGKESIAIDLKTEAGKHILHKLARKADVLLHNFRPGVAERLGVDYDTMSQLNPSLVYLYAAAYGSSGPNVHRPAFAPAINAITGAGFYMNGEGNPPQSAIHADPSSALGVATAAMVGLYAREATGRGQYIETSMICSASYALSDDFIQYEGKPPRTLPDKGQHGFGALYRLYETRDGWLFLACPRDGEWEAFCRAAGVGHLIADKRFSSSLDRSRNGEALLAIIQNAFQARTAVEWEEAMLARGVPCVRADGPRFKQFFVTDDSIKENGFIAKTQYVDFFVERGEYVDFGEYWRHGNTVHFSEMGGNTGPPCGIGDHTQSIMLELGYPQEEIEALKAQGVVTWGLGWAAHG